ncbi:MAG: hypothetical protein QXJ28_02355 [Candidatus Pacearchaeota archaeon]
MVSIRRITSWLIKPKFIEDLYKLTDIEDYSRGRKAVITAINLKNILENELEILVTGMYFWTCPEYFPPRKKIKTPRKPVTLLHLYGNTSKTQQIMDFKEFRKYDLSIEYAGNSSGGIKDNSVIYEFSVQRNGTPIKNFDSVCREILDKYGKSPEFQSWNSNPIDYVLLSGKDDISRGLIYMEIGKPVKIDYEIEEPNTRRERAYKAPSLLKRIGIIEDSSKINPKEFLGIVPKKSVDLLELINEYRSLR